MRKVYSFCWQKLFNAWFKSARFLKLMQEIKMRKDENWRTILFNLH